MFYLETESVGGILGTGWWCRIGCLCVYVYVYFIVGGRINSSVHKLQARCVGAHPSFCPPRLTPSSLRASFSGKLPFFCRSICPLDSEQLLASPYLDPLSL